MCAKFLSGVLNMLGMVPQQQPAQQAPTPEKPAEEAPVATGVETGAMIKKNSEIGGVDEGETGIGLSGKDKTKKRRGVPGLGL